MTVAVKESGADLYVSEEQYRRSVAARFNWHVMYTLLHNPDIRVTRKGYMQLLRQARQLGVHIPASDRQVDVNMDQLLQNIVDAKERLNPSSKKKGNDAYLVGYEDSLVNNNLDQIVAVEGGGKVSKQRNTADKNTKMSDVGDREKKGKGGYSLSRSNTEKQEARERSHLGHTAEQRPGTPKHIPSISV